MQPNQTVIVSVGDTMLGGAALPLIERDGWDAPFGGVRELMGRGDLLLGNLEGPITEHDERLMPERKWAYKQDPCTADVFAQLGFDAFHLANNHVIDYGATGLLDTLGALDRVGIRHFGAGANDQVAGEGIVVEKDGLRVGLIGWMQSYSAVNDGGGYATADRPGVAKWNRSQVRASLARLRERCDLLIASVHWGRNYRPITGTQLIRARNLIDWGADVVNGHHPHVPHGIEIHRGKPIVYSLGNFVFGTPGRFGTKKCRPGYGLVAAYVVRDLRVSRVELDVIAVDNSRVDFRPMPVDAEEAGTALNHLTAFLGTTVSWAGTRAIINLS